MRDWDYLRYSIAHLFNFNLFGMPFTGADVCGFFGAKDDDLCARWYQLAVFYPFARSNYNATETKDYEPYNLGADQKTMVKDAMTLRMRYIRMMRTCLFELH